MLVTVEPVFRGAAVVGEEPSAIFEDRCITAMRTFPRLVKLDHSSFIARLMQLLPDVRQSFYQVSINEQFPL